VSGKSGHHERLDTVEASVTQIKGKTGDKDLDVAQHCASELKSVMNLIVSAGAKDKPSLHRIEVLSELVLGNLEARIDGALFGRSDVDTVLEAIVSIARDLDAVRATRATIILDEKVNKCREQMVAGEEAKARGQLGQLKQVMDGIKEPAVVMPGATLALDIISQVHAKVPGSTKITDILLKATIDLAKKILVFQIAWARDPARATAVKGLAARVDEVAGKLVLVMGAAWDPPMLPQVERLVREAARRCCTEALTGAEREIANKKCGKAFELLVALKPHWPELKDDSSIVLQVVGAFSKLQTLACQDFIAVSKAGQATVAGQIREFATKFDALRVEFEGLPPAAGGPLKDCLVLGEATATVEKQLTFLVAEIANPTSDAKLLQLSLSGIVQAFEALVPIWDLVAGQEEALMVRFSEICISVEAWVDGLAAASSTADVGSLLTFAEEYDGRRTKLSPPEPASGKLQPRIALQAADKHTTLVEAELAKADGLNPIKLLDAFKAAAAALPRESSGDALRARLTSAMATTTERMLKSFREAITAGQVRKEEALLRFARDFDEAFAAAGLGLRAGGELGASLAERMARAKDGDAEAKLQALEVALVANDLPAALVALQGLQPSWPRIAEMAALKERAVVALGSLPALFEKAGEAAASPEKVDSLLEIAGDLDAALAPLEGAFAVPPLKPQVLWIAARIHLDALDAALENVYTAETAVVKRELSALAKLVKDASGDETEILERLANMGEPLARHLLHRALADAGGLEEVLGIAALVDGATGGSMRQQAEQLRPLVERVVESRTELAKPSGMDPRVVIRSLKALAPLWASACSSEEFQRSLSEPFRRALSEIFRQLSAKLTEACGKALDSGVEVPKKTQALLALADEAQHAQDALKEVAADLEVVDFPSSVARSVADKALGAVEAELGKESGLDPAKVLKGVELAAPMWAASTKADDSLEARLQAIFERLRSRMGQSMLDAKESDNQKKQTMLLEFAAKFDTACAPMTAIGSDLKIFLEGKLSGTTKE